MSALNQIPGSQEAPRGYFYKMRGSLEFHRVPLLSRFVRWNSKDRWYQDLERKSTARFSSLLLGSVPNDFEADFLLPSEVWNENRDLYAAPEDNLFALGRCSIFLENLLPDCVDCGMSTA